MQGTLFTGFADMVIEQQGMKTWDQLLGRVRPQSKGIYTAAQQYDDSELTMMVKELSVISGVAVKRLLVAFGQYMFKRLYDNSPADVSGITDLRTFLLAIDSVIHAEVKRLHRNAYLPVFEYADGDNGALIMYYHSKRMLCSVAEGLIFGAAEQFNQTIRFSHPECMHKDFDRCKFVICFGE
jgi:hypothetical protein